MADDPTKQAGENEDPTKESGSEAAAQSDKGQGDGTEQNAEQNQETKTIEITPEVLKALRSEIKSLKDQNALYKAQQSATQHLNLNPTQMPNPANVPQGHIQTPQVVDGEVTIDVDDEDVITGADMKKIIKQYQQGNQHVDPALVQRLAYVELGQQDPNWQATIQKYLPDMINTNPLVAQQIRESANPLQAALVFAKMNPAFTADQEKSKGDLGDGSANEDNVLAQIDKIIENAEKPGGGAQQSGSPGVNTGDKFTNMSDEDFDEHLEKVLQGQT